MTSLKAHLALKHHKVKKKNLRINRDITRVLFFFLYRGLVNCQPILERIASTRIFFPLTVAKKQRKGL